jgi:hypothetical protein
MIRSVIAGAILALIVGQAHADVPMTTMALLDKCEHMERHFGSLDAGTTASAGLCVGFFWGALQFTKQEPGGMFCTPDGVTYQQIIAVFTTYARANPQMLHLPAGVVAGASLHQAFPCDPTLAQRH